MPSIGVWCLRNVKTRTHGRNEIHETSQTAHKTQDSLCSKNTPHTIQGTFIWQYHHQRIKGTPSTSAMKKSKLVTLKVPREELSHFPDLTAHIQKKSKVTKPKIKVKLAKEEGDRGTVAGSKQSFLSTSASPKTSSSVKLTLKLGGGSLTAHTENADTVGMDIDEEEQQAAQSSVTPPVATLSPMPSLTKIPVSIMPSSTPSSAGNGTSTTTPNITSAANNNANNGSKMSSNVRVGVSGLSMNPHIVRDLDTSKRHAGKWVRYDAPAKEVHELQARVATTLPTTATKCIKKTNPGTTFKPVRSHLVVPEPETLENVHGMITIKDVRGYKEHTEKEKEIKLIEEAPFRGRRVIRSFTGYLMFCPGWHRRESGDLEKRSEYVEEKGKSTAQGKAGKDSRSGTSKNSPVPKSTPNAEVVVAPATAAGADSGAGAGASVAAGSPVSTTPTPKPE